MRSQKKIRNKLLETGGESFQFVMFVINLAEWKFAFEWSIELVTDKLGYLCEEVSKEKHGSSGLVSTCYL